MKTIKIDINDNNKRLDNYLLKLFPNIKRTEIFKLIRNKKIKINNKKTEFNYRLKTGDQISIYSDIDNYSDKEFKFKFLECKTKIDIVYEDKNVLFLNKPIGIISHEDKTEKINTLNNVFKKYLYDTKQ